MTSALIVLLAPGRQAPVQRPGVHLRPRCAQRQDITIAELLKMRSGLYGYTDAPELAAALDADPTKVWTPQEVLAIAFQRPPKFPADTSYDYSNTNYALLGLIAEKVGGRPLAQQIPGPIVRPAWAAADFASRRRRQLHPGSLLARLYVRWILLRTGRQAVPRRHAGRHADHHQIIPPPGNNPRRTYKSDY